MPVETLNWVSENVLPWIAAVITAIIYGAAYLQPIIKKWKVHIGTITESVSKLKDSTDSSAEINVNAINEIANTTSQLFAEIKQNINALPIEEMKKVEVSTCDAIIQHQQYFKLMFDWLHEMAMTNAALSPEEKDKLQKLYENTLVQMSKTDLSATMQKVREHISGGATNESETSVA